MIAILIFGGLAFMAVVVILFALPLGIGAALAQRTSGRAEEVIGYAAMGAAVGLVMGLCLGFFITPFFIDGVTDNVPGVWMRIILIGGGIGLAFGALVGFFD